MKLLSALQYSHQLVAAHLQSGDTVIDATMGNGSDTLFLARLTGSEGTVYSFDIQKQALEKTRKLLNDALEEQTPVHLLQLDHARMLEAIPVNHHGRVAAVMFNLGYLPGSDHVVVTRAESTLAAANQALKLIKPGGVITFVIYTGHDGGETEARALEQFAEQLPQQNYQALLYRFMNQVNHPPLLIAIKDLRDNRARLDNVWLPV